MSKPVVKLHDYKSAFVGCVSLWALLAVSGSVAAAEWKLSPSLTSRVEYNDNPRLYPDSFEAEGSTVYTLNPRLNMSAEELNRWDASLDINAKLTRYEDIDNADNNNIFVALDTGRKTELTEWRLGARLEENTNFDSDFDTKTPDAGLFLDDKTVRNTLAVTPSAQWMLSETSMLNFSIGRTDVSFDETSNTNYLDYTYDNLQLSYTWLFSENQRIGLTGAYSEYDSPERKYSFDQTVLSLDYTYTINETSNISMSVGSRQLDSLVEDVTVACDINGTEWPIAQVSTTGDCPASSPPFLVVSPIIDDITQKNDGTVVNLAYSNQYQRSSFRLDMSRSVIPSSFGSAQEEKRAGLSASHALTERLNSGIQLSASETRTLDGVSSISDRDRMHLSASLVYKLSRDVSLSLLYNYIEQTIIATGQDGSSNAIMVNLQFGWPRLATTY
ncbi:MAG TPA: hypothetical protein VIQ81_11465 [Gammaproteobacteria bacterium]